MTSFEDALADAIRSAKFPADKEAARKSATAQERASAIAGRREAIAGFLRRMEAAGSPGLTTITLIRHPPGSRTPTHRRFRRQRHADGGIRREQESAYLVPHRTMMPLGKEPLFVVRPYWVTTDGAAIWASGHGDAHEVDLRDIVPLTEDLAPSLTGTWAAAVSDQL